jgi:hypothetical protein
MGAVQRAFAGPQSSGPSCCAAGASQALPASRKKQGRAGGKTMQTWAPVACLAHPVSRGCHPELGRLLAVHHARTGDFPGPAGVQGKQEGAPLQLALCGGGQHLRGARAAGMGAGARSIGGRGVARAMCCCYASWRTQESWAGGTGGWMAPGALCREARNGGQGLPQRAGARGGRAHLPQPGVARGRVKL